MAEHQPIEVLMGKVLAELPAIGKNARAPTTMGGYSFRGIEDVLSALNPVLAKHGVFIMPSVVDRRDSVREVGQGKSMYVVDLHMRFAFSGPAGDCLCADAWGEGTDMGDKATQKAMTAAFKYVLFEVFCISAEDQAGSDGDRSDVPASVPTPPAGPTTLQNEVFEMRAKLSPAKRDEIRQSLTDRQWPLIVDRMTEEQLLEVKKWILELQTVAD